MNVSSICGVNNSKIYVDDSVSKNFAENTISQYNRLLQNSSENVQAKNLFILKNAENAADIKGLDSENLRYFEGDGQIAYGLYAADTDTIFIMEDTHGRKNVKYEGETEFQGQDTLTHEFGHLLDKGASTSKAFQNAYLKDLKNLENLLQTNPYRTIGNSDMTALEAVEYFKHYIEGADFSDGIDEKDITRKGVRENFAESFSNIFDSNKSEVNDIYAELFKNSMQAVKKVFIA